MELARALWRSPFAWCAAIGLAVWIASDFVLDGLARDPRFLAEPEWRRARGPGSKGVIEPVLARLEKLGPVNLFDPEFDGKIRGALAEVPGVRSVASIRRKWPRRYRVRVIMERPVAVAVVGGRPVPVTADAVALPAKPYREAAAGLPLIIGLHGAPAKLGEVWDSERLRDGIATALQLAPHADRLAAFGITSIDVAGARLPREGVVLHGADNIRVRWGRPRNRVGENSVARKVRYLQMAAEHIEKFRGHEIEVRFGALYWRKRPAEP